MNTKISIDDLFERIQLVKKINAEQPLFPSYEKYFDRKINTMSSVSKLNRKLLAWDTILRYHGIDLENKKVLVVGCGAGWECVYMYAMGAKEVVGLEVMEMFVKGMEKMFPILGLHPTVKPILQDIHTYSLDSYYDLILTVDAISHMYDHKLFLSSCFKLLAPNGSLLIIDDNNALNYRRRKEVANIWESWEKYGLDLKSNDGKTMHINSYEQDRYEYIVERFPELSKEAKSLAERTANFNRQQIDNAILKYKKTGIMPNSVYRRGVMAYDSKYDMPKEKQFNPYTLAHEIRSARFENAIHLPDLITTDTFFRKNVVKMLIVFKPFSYFFVSKGFSVSGRKSSH
ncbi:MAG TPA: class I SAM-dependent methyltransferase [bacterium]|nr:class I SAM-dependent methyltransferase [bacterium]HMW31926.1 class I SAM-dependent methyltransferase [bacterium]HMY34516.1 class I SAM-dependent methyltransferase [bacterium]HMZ03788.1 class I SAM-dependent methyltransferase [bacterium]HNB07934.1 class I SAM-dependent methyltransferase [bacterium]